MHPGQRERLCFYCVLVLFGGLCAICYYLVGYCGGLEHSTFFPYKLLGILLHFILRKASQEGSAFGAEGSVPSKAPTEF